MKARVFILGTLSIFILISCNKETATYSDDLIGTWVEVSLVQDKQVLHFVNQHTLYYEKPFARYVGMETLTYYWNKGDDIILLKFADCLDCPLTPFKISFNDQGNELTIWGLYQFDPESKYPTTVTRQ